MLRKIVSRRSFATHLSKFATIDPKNLDGRHKAMNLVNGEWTAAANYRTIPDPMTGKAQVLVPETSLDEIEPFIDSLANTPRYGLHNPFHNKERYLMLGQVCRKAVEVLYEKETFDFFCDSIIKTIPKSRAQTEGEMRVTRAFFENFSGD